MSELPPFPATLRFRTTLRTRWSDEDNHGVLNNAVYLTLLEETRLAYFTGLGLMVGNRFPFTLARCDLSFRAPGIGGREVWVEASTIHLGGKSFTQAYRLGDGATDTLWCEARAVLVCTDPGGASCPIPPEFRAAVEAFEAGS